MGALLVLALFWLLGLAYFGGYRLDLGSIHGPTPRYAQMLAIWNALGSVATALLALGLAKVLGRGERLSRLYTRVSASRPRRFLALAAALAVLVVLLLDRVLLRGRPLADDEHAYLFMAQLLGSGRLSVGSPPMKAFFDNAFLINDGALYAKYSLGWPALLAPFAMLGVPFVANALCLALTLPPLYHWLARDHGPVWGGWRPAGGGAPPPAPPPPPGGGPPPARGGGPPRRAAAPRLADAAARRGDRALAYLVHARAVLRVPARATRRGPAR